MTPRVLIVIVNYRTADLVVDCLRSLEPEVTLVPGLQVVVTDNDSGDGSAPRIAAAIDSHHWSRWARCMPLPKNGGFPYGNNAAIRPDLASASPADYYLLLNPDTLVKPRAVAALVEYMEAHPEVGIAGSKLVELDGTVQCSAHRMMTPLTELLITAKLGVLTRLLRRYDVNPPVPATAAEADWVSGASFFVRRAVFEQVGLMDEGYFLYYDEVDFCQMTKRGGWKIAYVPDSCVMHLEGQATGIRAQRQRRGKWWYESRRRYFLKHYGVLGLITADLLWMVGRASLVTRRALRLGGGTNTDPTHFARDLLLGDLRAMCCGELRVRYPQPAAPAHL
jgi:GT2 family glycosyltransferase